MMDVLRRISRRRTPQSSPAHETQIANAAGGYTFATADDARLHRFLTLGTSGGTYYTSAEELTREAAEVVFRAAATDPIRLVQRIVEVSEAGRAPKQNPALFALAIAASCEDVEGRRAACAALPAVARTGTHLFQFANYIEQFRGWGPALRRSVGSWYLDKSVDQLAYQVVKYRQRDGWTHRDLLRLAHPRTAADDRRALFEFVIIGRGHGLSWEMLPDAALNLPEVWEALLDKGVPQTALMRQLPRLTRLGLLSGATGHAVAAQLHDAIRLRRARVHPVNVLVAARTYARGRSDRGSSTWSPEPGIVDALDAAFYAAYRAVEPSGGRVLLALDVSGSMDCRISG
ncbi:60kDa SS-A/Ro ribonucleoprotein like protein, partial [Aduncisulcus paluster]